MKSSMTGRRTHVRLLPFVLCAVLLMSAGCGAPMQTDESFVMHTVLQQTLYGPHEVCEENVEIARNLEQKLSRTLETSEIARAIASSEPVEVSEDTAAVMDAALRAWRETGGAFDPSLGRLRDAWGFGRSDMRVPEEAEIGAILSEPGAEVISLEGNMLASGGAALDLGGAAKGYVLDKMETNMRSQDVNNALISFGGAILAMGHRADGKEWNIGIRDPMPEAESDAIAAFRASDTFISTSGIAEQGFEEGGTYWHHLLDPKTGYPSENGLAAVLVAMDSGTASDIWSTALFIMGPEEGFAQAEERGIGALFIGRDKVIRVTSAFPYELTDLAEGYEVR